MAKHKQRQRDIQKKADDFDQMWEDSLRRAREKGIPDLPEPSQYGNNPNR